MWICRIAELQNFRTAESENCRIAEFRKPSESQQRSPRRRAPPPHRRTRSLELMWGHGAARCPKPPQLKHFIALPLFSAATLFPAHHRFPDTPFEKWLSPQVQQTPYIGLVSFPLPLPLSSPLPEPDSCCSPLEKISQSGCHHMSNMFRSLDLSLFLSAPPPPQRSRPRRSTASLHCPWAEGLSGHTLHVSHQLDLRFELVVVQFLGAQALSNRQLHLIWEHLQQQ